jgi:hypothetical protein
MADYLTTSEAELAEKLFKVLKLLLNDKEIIRSVATIKLSGTHGFWQMVYAYRPSFFTASSPKQTSSLSSP